ncbi:MAG: hypothetical protein R3D45_13310 [Rhizobiaceae bacterium]
MSEAKENGSSTGSGYAKPITWAAIAFGIGLATDALNLFDKITTFISPPAIEEPQLVNRYTVVKLNGLGEVLPHNLTGPIIQNSIYTSTRHPSVFEEKDAEMLAFARNQLTANPDEYCLSETCADVIGNEIYMMFLNIENVGQTNINNLSLEYDLFELSYEMRNIVGFSIAHQSLENGCLVDFEKPCALRVGDVQPQSRSAELPDLKAGHSINVPMYVVLVPFDEHGEINEIWLQYLVGPAIHPKSVVYRFNNNRSEGRFELRQPADNITKSSDVSYGLG